MSEVLVVRDGLAALASRLAELGTRKTLILTGASRRHADAAEAAFAGQAPEVFDGARVHVPADVVERATERLRASGADTIVAIGGGSAIGLGKALRLSHQVRFAAVPTTYAGSEMTTMYGITRERDKQTGRDPRVRPDLVLYDVAFVRDTPIALTAQSLLNAFAHVASVAASLEDRTAAFAAGHAVLRALEDLLLAPRAVVAREAAARAASACAEAFDRGRPGVQHALAHLLGGALNVDHAALHAILLPQFLAHLRVTMPTLLDALEVAVERRDLDAYVHDLLVRSGAPVTLTALGATGESVRAALATRAELPAVIALDALYGLRPPGRGGRIVLGALDVSMADPPEVARTKSGGAEALILGPPPAKAKRIVLALHGRGAEAGTIARRYREIAAHDPDTCVIGLRSEDHLDRWYAVKYGQPGAGRDPEVRRALARVHMARSELAAYAPVIVAGFSQGACLALEYAAHHGVGLAGVIAPCGSRIGRPVEWEAPVAYTGMPVLLGAAADKSGERRTRSSAEGDAKSIDKWIAHGDLDATAAWFRSAGARVDVINGGGDRHEITARQRLRAREIILDRPEPRGIPGALDSEARPGAVPAHQNTPRLSPLGLYPEQLNGTPFTAPRAANQRTWCYRVRPSAQRRAYTTLEHPRIAASFGDPATNLVGFAALPLAGEHDFLDGLVTLCGAGDAKLRRGYAVHRYAATRSMNSRAFYSADGDLLILPEHGALTLLTELGPLEVAPGSLAVIPRGVVFSVLLHDAAARGYVAEPFGRHFQLPERGVIGANGLVDARHLRPPSAWFEERFAPDFRIVGKHGGVLQEASQDHSPFDVAGWHGNYVPYVYDLADFAPSANAAFDHGDPSVYTVLSAPLDDPGTNTLDLVVFPARWDVSAHTFRPPFFHRNAVAEINGIVKEHGHGVFQPGIVFITPPFTAHGISGRGVERARHLDDAADDRPEHLAGTLWFQLESALAPAVTPWSEPLDDWAATWGSHRSYFE
ncbi:MAG: iron-containing alcohol dehydrogenase [Kofleriaceae bacterium]